MLMHTAPKNAIAMDVLHVCYMHSNRLDEVFQNVTTGLAHFIGNSHYSYISRTEFSRLITIFLYSTMTEDRFEGLNLNMKLHHPPTVIDSFSAIKMHKQLTCSFFPYV